MLASATLKTLAQVADALVVGDARIEITDVSHDSRTVGPGCLFVAIRGHVVDGHDFVPIAVSNGATALCVEDQTVLQTAMSGLVVDDSRAALARLAAVVHGDPSQRLSVVGITGTNGKTTVAYLLRSILAAATPDPVGMIGTNGAFLGSVKIPNVRTTPESSDLQRILASMEDGGASYVVLEVSSHALELERVASTRFSVAAFTNLSQDHLDFHPDMEAYFQVKARLFEGTATPVISLSSDWGTRLFDMLEAPELAITVGKSGVLVARDIELNLSGSRFVAQAPDGEFTVSLPLVGRLNVDNALVAIGCAMALQIDTDAIVTGLRELTVIPGRFERIGTGPCAVFVDYAHTPDGIRAAIASARDITDQRVIVVVGAGGDRDASKRSLMGQAASTADEVWVTSDNPRSEDPGTIIEAIVRGAEAGSKLHVEPDRAAAIRAAVLAGTTGDTVLILGKGHEQGQDVSGVVYPFDDRVHAAQALKELAR